MWKDRYLPIAAGLSIALLVFFAVQFVRGHGLLFGVEATVYDHWCRQLPKAASTECVIVNVSESDIQAWKQYPISDLKMAELLTKLSAMGPRVIGVDIYRDIGTPDLLRHSTDRTALDRVLAGDPTATQPLPQIISCYLLNTNGTRVAPPPAVAGDLTRQGFVNIDQDSDGLIRRALLYHTDPDLPGDARYSLAAILVDQYFAADDASAEKLAKLPSVQESDLFYPVGSTAGRSSGLHAQAAREILLDFRGPKSFPMYTVEDILAGRVDPAVLRDKIVLVGVNTPSIKDFVSTPCDGKLPGVQLHAQVCDQLLRLVAGPPPLASYPPTVQMAWSLAVGLTGWAIGWFVRSPWKVVLGVGLTGAFVWWAGWWSLEHFAYLAVVPPVLNGGLTAAMVTSYRAYRERADRNVMSGLVDRMMSRRIASMLWTRRDELLENGHLKPQLADATILFSDLQGFTAISELLDPPVLLKWLNSYFQLMSDLVERHDGVVNKYVGDAVMAVFGPPLPSEGEVAAKQNAGRAIKCALAMRRALVELRTNWCDMAGRGWTAGECEQLQRAITEVGLETLCIRIGICSGKVVAGSLGSRDRLEYTVIGPTVNLASRLEGWDKSRMEPTVAPDGCRILINDTACQLVNADFVTAGLGEYEIKGIDEPVGIHAVLSSVA